jgi:O-antigen/teichoic acid export membrane protein
MPPEASGKDKDVRHAALGAGTNFLTILAGVSEVIFHPLIAHVFGTATYGLYRLGFNTLEPLLRLSPLGTDKGLLRHVAMHRIAGEVEQEVGSLRTGLWLTLLAGLCLGGLAFALAGPLAAWQDEPRSATAIRWLAPSVVLSAMILVLVAATMGAKIMRYNLLVRGLAQPVALLVLALGFGWLSTSLTSLCLAHLVTMGLVAGLAALAMRRVFRDRVRARSLVAGSPGQPFLNRSMVRFSIPMGLAEFLNAVQQRADLILLGFLTNAETVGVYAGAEAISRVVANIRYAFDPVASPVMAEAYRQGDLPRLTYNLRLMTRWTTLLTLPIAVFVVLFRMDLLRLFPEAFLSTQAVFVLLVAGHTVSGVLGLTGFAVLMSGRSWLGMVNNAVAALVNIGLTLWLVPRLGMLGAGVSALASVSVIQLLFLVETWVFMRVHPFSPELLKAWTAAGLVLGAGLLLEPLLTFHPILRVLAGVAGVLGLYLGLLVAFGLSSEEREVLGKLRARLRRMRS